MSHFLPENGPSHNVQVLGTQPHSAPLSSTRRTLSGPPLTVTQLTLDGEGAWPDLHLENLSPQINVLYGPPRTGKSSVAQLLGHLMYGISQSPWRRSFRQEVATTEGSLQLGNSTEGFVLRRHNETGDTHRQSRLTISSSHGDAIDGQTIQNLLSGLSPPLAAQVFFVDFAESPRADRLLSEAFAREFASSKSPPTPPLRPRGIYDDSAESSFVDRIDRRCLDQQVKRRDAIASEIEQQELDELDSEITRCRQTLASSQQRENRLRTELAQLMRVGTELGKQLELLLLRRKSLIHYSQSASQSSQTAPRQTADSLASSSRLGAWRASDILAQLTDGHLVQIRLDRHLSQATIIDRHGQAHTLESLSGSQHDQLYLALMLSLVSSYALRDVRLPLVLDEPFLQQNAAQTTAMVGLLDAFARAGHQLFVFTEERFAQRRFAALDATVFDLQALHQARPTLSVVTKIEPEPTVQTTMPLGNTHIDEQKDFGTLLRERGIARNLPE